MQSKLYKKNTGFTLIEVLIAATILFTVIAVVSQSYRSAMLSSEKARRSTELSGVVPLLLDTIRFRLTEADINQIMQQQGVLNGFRFEWSAKVIKKGSPPPRFELETDSYVTLDEKFYLWDVQLNVVKNDYSQQFTFTELTWRN